MLEHLVRVPLEIALGFVFGVVGGLFGIGGGLVGIPVLALFGYDQQHAQGTALAMIFPNVVMGFYHYWRRGGLDMRMAATLAISGLAFMYVGAHVATHVPSAPLRIAFATFQCLLGISVAIRLLRKPSGPAVPAGPRRPRWPWPAAIPIGAAGGVISGLFGVGGAVFAVPLFTLFFGFTQAQAQGMGLAMVAPGTLITITTYALARDVDWSVGIPLAIGGFFSVPVGVGLAHRLPDRTLRLLFCGLLFVSGAALYARA